jgi:hypothetical protein
MSCLGDLIIWDLEKGVDVTSSHMGYRDGRRLRSEIGRAKDTRIDILRHHGWIASAIITLDTRLRMVSELGSYCSLTYQTR